jgi:hypothetical protein
MPEEGKKDAGEKKAEKKVAAPAKPANIQQEQKLSLEGDKKAVVNPETKAAGVSLPTGEVDDNGNAKFDNFDVGEVYYVSDDALQKKNTEGVNYLVEAE